VRQTDDSGHAQRLIAGVLPPVVASALEPVEFAALHQRLKRLPEPVGPARLHKEDWLGAAGVFLLVFLSTFPVVLPFLFMRDVRPALHLSNTIAVAMLAVSGFAFGRITGRHPWLIGAGMVIVGAVVVAFTIALGG
jgi:VIT1/CCC1 family predicted Fe2+/Mn2+ transporter